MNINTSHNKYERGFTIVELLIVIVVIAILAAITIVSYNGITARGNTTNATMAAENVSKKAETYNVELSGYPATYSALSGASSSASYYVPASIIFTATAIATAPANPSTINFYKCGTNGTTTAPTTTAGITNITGSNIGSWNYSTSAVVFDPAGVTSGFVGTYPIACIISAT